MKKLLLLITLITSVCLAFALVNEYSFSQSTQTYTEITGGTVVTTGNIDDTQYVLTLPFPFSIGGTTASAMAMSTNGYLSFDGGTTSFGYTAISSTAAGTGVVAPMSRDLRGRPDGEMRYEVFGTSPNQYAVYQWKNWTAYGTSYVDDNWNFQVILYETSNNVAFRYGPFTWVSAYTNTAQVGLRGTANTDYNNRQTTDNWSATVPGGANNSTCRISTTVYPSNGLQFLFEPPDPNAPPNPASLIYPGLGDMAQLDVNLQWASGGGVVEGYYLYFGTDGGGTTAPTNLVNGTNLGMATTYQHPSLLAPATTYYWQIVPWNTLGGNAAGCPIWNFVTTQPLTGVKNIGPGGDYTTFTQAIDALNLAGIGAGGVTFNVAAGLTFTENCPPITTTGSAENPIVFQKSGAGANPIIYAGVGTGTTDAIVTVSGVDYLTWDGIDLMENPANADNTTKAERGLWVKSDSATNGAQYNEFKNFSVALDNTYSSTRGIYHYYTTTPTDDAGTNSNNDYYNITVDSAYYGMYVYGTSSTTYIEQNNRIRNCTIGGEAAGSMGAYGIYTYYQMDLEVYGNEVRNLSHTSTLYGMYLYYLKGTGNMIHGNRVHDLAYTGTSTSVNYGMYVYVYTTGANEVKVYNNMVWGQTHTYASSSTSWVMHGIYMSSAGSSNIYNVDFNSVRIEGPAGASSSALYFSSVAGTNKIRNNILTNYSPEHATPYHVCMYMANATSIGQTGSVSNNNLYLVGTGGYVVRGSTTNYPTLGDWQTASLQDGGSFFSDPQFLSPTNLHINPAVPTRVESNGSFFGGELSWVGEDIDEETRNATTPDIGADEGDFTPVAGVPGHVVLVNPPNNADDVDPAAAILGWNAPLTGGTVDFYGVYVGPDPIDPVTGDWGTNYYETTDTYLNLSEQGDIVVGYDNTWYWAVLPFNGTPPASPDPNDPAFMVWQFTTQPDPTISVLPHQEYFDGVTAPELPWGWGSFVNSTSTYAVVATYSSTTYAVTPPNSARLYNSTDLTAELVLISPPFSAPLNTLKTRFYARSSTAGETLLVGTWNPATDTFTQVGSVTPLTTTQTQYDVPLNSYMGSDTHIAFKHGVGTSSRSIYVDNVEFIEMVDHDLAATSVTGPGYAVAGTSNDFIVAIKNEGMATQNNYTVKLMSTDTRTELASLLVTTPIDPGATAQHTLPWTPAAAGNFDIYGKVVLAGDQTPTNDDTPTISVSILPVDTTFLGIGNPETTTTANTLPTNVYYKNGVTETLYFPDEMHLVSGNITGLVYKNSFTQQLNGLAFKIWMGTTTETDLSGGWLPSAGFTQVFDGTLDLPLGENEVFIPLQTPFAYTGDNLVVRWNRVMDTVYYNSTNVWYYTDTAATYPDRSRYLQSDGTTYDPLNPSAAGTLLSRVPNTWLVVNNAVVAQQAILQGHVYQSGTTTPLEGVTVSLTERETTTTDENGFYQFIFWQSGTYDATYTLPSYYDQAVTGLAVTMGSTTTQDIYLVAMPRVTVTGDVFANDAPGGLEGASVTVSGPETYAAITDMNGHFSIPNVLGSNAGINYTLTVEKEGYTAYSGTFDVFEINVNVGTVNLTEIAYPAYNLEATLAGANAELAWDPAGPPAYYFSDFETDDGGWVASGIMDWQWTNTYNVANYVVGGYPASEVPPPTAYSGTGLWGTVLYGPYSMSGSWAYLTRTIDLSAFANPQLRFWRWNNLYYAWDYYEVKVNGTTVMTESAIDNNWVEKVVDLSVFAGQTVDIQFAVYATTVVSYAGLYLDDIYIGPATTRLNAQLGSRNGDRVFQHYDVYRFLEADEGNPGAWTQLESAWATTTYTDTGFAAVPGGTYKWAVVANYSGTLESDPVISNGLVKPDVSIPQNLTIVRDGTNINLSWDAQPGADFFKVYAATDPYGTFTYLGYNTTNSYVVVAPAEPYKFFIVTAVVGEPYPTAPLSK